VRNDEAAAVGLSDDGTHSPQPDAAGALSEGSSRAWTIARALAWDLAVALVVVALIVATILFASHISSFIYVDF